MKKILCIIDTLRIGGGAQTQIVGLASMLKEAGYEVKALSYFEEKSEKNFAPNLIEKGIDTKCLVGANHMYDKLIGVFKEIQVFQPNYIIAYLDGPATICSIIKMFYPKFRLIVSERNVTQRLTLKERIKFHLYRITDKIIPNAYSQEKFIKQHYSFLKMKIHTISNFVDIDRFRIKAERNSCCSTLYIITVARIGEQKNVLGFLDALQLLKAQGVKVHIDWYGFAYPKYSYLCFEKVSKLKLEDYITFHDSRKDIEAMYMSPMYDVFCLPSFFEGCPNTIGEAMSCGLPVLCSDVCDNSRYVENGINGFLFNPLSCQDIADTIKRFIALSVDERKEMGKKSRIYAEERLSKKVFITQYLEILNEFYGNN